jgi:hypothetical protein
MSVSGSLHEFARLMPYPMDRCCYCRLPFNVGQQWQGVANDAMRVRFHAACYENGISWLRVSLRATTISPFASTA